jgi:hypothetical protein
MTNQDLWLKGFREWLQQRPVKTRAEASPDLFFQSEQGQSSQLPALDAGQRASLLRAMWIDLFDACLRADLPVSVQSWQHRLPAGGMRRLVSRNCCAWSCSGVSRDCTPASNWGSRSVIRSGGRTTSKIFPSIGR